jgi:hypothetical protein
MNRLSEIIFQKCRLDLCDEIDVYYNMNFSCYVWNNMTNHHKQICQNLTRNINENLIQGKFLLI